MKFILNYRTELNCQSFCWYRFVRYSGTDSCAMMVPFRRYYQGYYVAMLLCYCNIMFLGYYVVVLLCYCNVMLLGHHVVVLLCYQGITLLQYHNRAYFTYTLIINTLQFSLSSAYNFTITIYILLYDTD